MDIKPKIHGKDKDRGMSVRIGIGAREAMKDYCNRHNFTMSSFAEAAILRAIADGLGTEAPKEPA